MIHDPQLHAAAQLAEELDRAHGAADRLGAVLDWQERFTRRLAAVALALVLLAFVASPALRALIGGAP